MWLFDQLAEQHIQQAQQQGEFDHLPGYGKPLQLDDDSGVPQDLRVGYRLLKNAGYVPPEIQERKDALQLADLLRQINKEEAIYDEISARFRLLELKLRQAGMSTAFLHQGYQQQLQRHFEDNASKTPKSD